MNVSIFPERIGAERIGESIWLRPESVLFLAFLFALTSLLYANRESQLRSWIFGILEVADLVAIIIDLVFVVSD